MTHGGHEIELYACGKPDHVRMQCRCTGGHKVKRVGWKPCPICAAAPASPPPGTTQEEQCKACERDAYWTANGLANPKPLPHTHGTREER